MIKEVDRKDIDEYRANRANPPAKREYVRANGANPFTRIAVEETKKRNTPVVNSNTEEEDTSTIERNEYPQQLKSEIDMYKSVFNRLRDTLNDLDLEDNDEATKVAVNNIRGK